MLIGVVLISSTLMYSSMSGMGSVFGSGLGIRNPQLDLLKRLSGLSYCVREDVTFSLLAWAWLNVSYIREKNYVKYQKIRTAHYGVIRTFHKYSSSLSSKNPSLKLVR